MRLLFWLEEREKPLFTFQDARKALGGTVASATNVLKRLRKKKRVVTIQKGLYLFAPFKSGVQGHWSEDSLVVVPLLAGKNSYYLGFLSAMKFWDMTEQLPRTVHIVLKKRKKSFEALGSKFIFIRKKFFGEIVSQKIGDSSINVSSREQTILDGLLFPEYCLGLSEVANALNSSRSELDFGKLVLLAKKEKGIVRRRLGFLLEALKMGAKAKKLAGNFKGFNWLDPTSKKNLFGYSKKWGLKLNVSEKELLYFLEGY